MYWYLTYAKDLNTSSKTASEVKNIGTGGREEGEDY